MGHQLTRFHPESTITNKLMHRPILISVVKVDWRIRWH